MIAFLTTKVRVHVAVPPGMFTMSPSAADAMAAETSDSDALFALTVAAPAKRERARTRVVASETPGMERRTFASPLLFFGIQQLSALFRALNSHGCFGRGKTNSWVVRSNEVKGKPERT